MTANLGSGTGSAPTRLAYLKSYLSSLSKFRNRPKEFCARIAKSNSQPCDKHEAQQELDCMFDESWANQRMQN